MLWTLPGAEPNCQITRLRFGALRRSHSHDGSRGDRLLVWIPGFSRFGAIPAEARTPNEKNSLAKWHCRLRRVCH